MRHIILLPVPVWLYHNFPRYIINGKIFGGPGGEVIEHKMNLLSFLQLSFQKYFSFCEEFSEI